MEHLNKSLHKSTLEPHITDSTEDNPRTTSTSNLGGTLLAQCNLVSPTPTLSVMSSPLIDTSRDTNDISQNAPSLTISELEDSLRVEHLIRAKLVNTNLQEQATQDIMHHKLAPTKITAKTNFASLTGHTRIMFRIQTFRAQIWCVNFLASIRQTHNLQVSSLKTVREAVAYLNSDPASISSNTLVNYLDSLSRQAPSISIHREQIDMSPSLAYACTTPSRSTTSVKLLQQKLAFLLSMAAFLRPSDLDCVPFSS